MLPWHTTGIYDDPDAFGLRLVTDYYTTIAEDGSCSWYDVIAIWKNPEGDYLIGYDGNCECAKPFENTPPAKLTPVGTVADVRDFVKLYFASQVDEVTDSLTDGLALA